MTAPVLDDLQAAFDRAAARVDPVEETVDLAGEAVRFRVAGPDLAAALLRPFAPLRTSGEPVATVDLWSGEETGVDLPTAVTPEARRVHADADGMVLVQDRAATGLDRRTGRIVGHRDAAATLPAWDRAKPFSEVLALWLLDRGGLPVHAGSVEGALLIGPSGSGKSTAALAAAASGRGLHGDDHVAVRGTTVHALYGGLRAAPDLLTAAPWLTAAGDVVAVPGDKSVVFADRLAPPAPVRVLLAPTPAPGRGLRPLRPAEALRLVGPSTILGVVGGGAAAFQALGDLVAGVPAYALHHEGDPRRAADLVAEALG